MTIATYVDTSLGPDATVASFATLGLSIGTAPTVDPIRQGQFTPEHRSRRHKVHVSCDPALV